MASDSRVLEMGLPRGSRLSAMLRDIRRLAGRLEDGPSKRELAEFIDDRRQTDDAVIFDEFSDLETDDYLQLIRLAVNAGLHSLLAAYEVPHPIYNDEEGFEQNARGPWGELPAFPTSPTPSVWRLLGAEIGLPIGVPASVLTTSAPWIDYYARHGFNVLTYKTVRSRPWQAHLRPNWVFVKDLVEPVEVGNLPKTVVGGPSFWPADPVAFSMANSFGVPSFGPEVWMPDVERAQQLLSGGQLLIVSVMGTYEECSPAETIEDFVHVAQLAESAGAQAIELNLSCPNSVDATTGEVKKDLICFDPTATAEIVHQTRERLNTATRLVAKVAYMSRAELEEVLLPLLEEGVLDGVAGINTLQTTVVNTDGSPVFRGTASDPNAPRDPAGISGIAIRNYALEFVGALSTIRENNGLDFDILGMGGVMVASDVAAMLSAGATAVQTATAAFFNPSLPRSVRAYFGGAAMTPDLLNTRAQVLRALHESTSGLTFTDIAKTIQNEVPPWLAVADRVMGLLASLQDEGSVEVAENEGQLVYQVK